jgi:PAS domain-containing protein
VAGIFGVILITHLAITRPLMHTSDSLSLLAAGELPDVTVSKGGLPEINRIGKSLVDLIDRLRMKTGFARSLGEDELDNELPLAGKNDALGAELNRLHRKIKENAAQHKLNEEENIRRRYINDGLARFAEILRTSNNDITSLGDVFIRELVKYLGAIQGGFFLFEENNVGQPVLNLVSSFAYNRKKYLQKSLALGEGLVGTCAREKQMINMTEIPKGYISITSGLGDTRPDNLLLLPVLHENDLVGVLEVASLSKYLDHQLVFARDVASSLGSTLIYTRNNQRTAELLRKSQQQAQEMAEQEEEMRQNMEELKATQEESMRREEELTGMAEAINKALYVVTYAPDGRITHVNDPLCIFLASNPEDLEGRQHEEVFRGTLKPDSLFWEELERSGRTVVPDKVKIGKKETRLKFHFSTVFNTDGHIIRFISFITDLSV